MEARIYRPAQTAMQSGHGKVRDWVLEFEASAAKTLDPLMGGTSSADTDEQVRLRFPTKEEAIAYARKRGLAYRLDEAHERKIRPKAYADNFRWDRPE